jgi:hypothetical protein
MKRKFRSIIVIMILIIVSVLTIGCGSSKKEGTMSESKASMNTSDGNSSIGNSVSVKADAKSDSNLKKTLDNQGKIIRNGIIQMETLNFDEAVVHILNNTNNLGGYVQSSNISGKRIEVRSYEESRSGEFILRIPKTKFDSFMLGIGNLGSITSQQILTEDVTTIYFDTQAHLKSLNIQEERLLELLKKTGELKDIILLEKELSSVRYEIESLTGNLKKWDNLIDYCTLNINLREVYKIKENHISFGDKIVNGFVDSVKSLMELGKDFIVIMSISIPYLVILCIILFIIRYIYKQWKRK